MSYLQALGATDLYASPIFKAMPGSTHGYDVTDPTVLNPELGTPEDFDRFAAELRKRGMRLLLDIVPNHMAASPHNPWWHDVLENGRASAYADFFDIDWTPAGRRRLQNRVLLPVLGAPLDACLNASELSLTISDDGMGVQYYDNCYPLDPATYHLALAPALGALTGAAAGAAHAVIERSRAIQAHDDARAVARRERVDLCDATKAALAAAVRSHPRLHKVVRDALSETALKRLLEAQAYQFDYWRTGVRRLNYRRFFDIADLVGVRVEDRRVFDATHALVIELVRSGAACGVRVDHVDGLRDPAGYLRRLRAALGPEATILVEKILSPDEQLPPDWPVNGTTGYDFLDHTNRLFVSPHGLRDLEDAWVEEMGSSEEFARVVYREKKRVSHSLFPGELRGLARRLGEAIEAAALGEFKTSVLSTAIVEVTARLPVYRTYIRGERASEIDRRLLEEAVTAAANGRRGEARRAIGALWRVLTLDFPPGMDAPARRRWTDFIERWQQFSGAVMAKGQEDTAFYVYSPLVSVNAIGGNPVDLMDPEIAFHHRNHEAARRYPLTLNASSTHDTKRSEDVRSRIDVLSEIPESWLGTLRHWRKMNQRLKDRAAGERAPDANEESVLYQTLLGSWPLDGRLTADYRARLKAYMVKAAREAKVHTSWLDPNEAHEAALTGFVDRILSGGRTNAFLRDLTDFERRVSYFGAVNSLAQVLLKVASPGVPDFYQGTETWEFSLVDPDNRRPVDFAALRKALRGVSGPANRRTVGLLFRQWRDGRIKTYVVQKALAYRRANADLFLRGRYVPLRASGPLAGNVVAFARVLDRRWAVTIVPRLLAPIAGEENPPLGDFWEGTTITLPVSAPRRFSSVLTSERVDRTGRTLSLADCFRALPVAMLAG